MKPALVNSALQQIAYSNNSDTPPASVQINWTFNDNNSGSQGTGGALSGTGSISVNITPTNDPPIAVNDSYSVNEDSSLAVAWWDTDWTRRSQITLSGNTFAGSENLTNFPVLVVLNSGNVDYSLTQDAGQDLRFFDADGTALAYEIESWNESGNSYVWVRVPQVDTTGTDSIFMYFGNATAAAGQDAATVWSGNNLTGVYHLNDVGTSINDSSLSNYDGTSGGTVAAVGQIGGSRDFERSFGNYIDLGTNRSFIDGADGATLTAWINRESTLGTAEALLATSINNCGVPSNASRVTLQLTGDNLTALVRTDHSTTTTISTTTNPLAGLNGSWHHVAVAVDAVSDTILFYMDGNLIDPATYSETISLLGTTFLNTPSGGASLGANEQLGNEYFDGLLDEARFARTELSAAWLKAEFLTSTNSFVTVGAAETAPSTGGVIGNDSDVDSPRLNAVLISGPSNAASFTLNPDGTFNYTPTANFAGSDSFTYKVNDGSADSNVATVIITVNPVNDAPTITNGYIYNLTGTNEDTTSSGTLASTVLSGAAWADVDSGAVSGLAITGMTGNGTWQYSTDGVTWNSFGAVSSANALLITSTTQVRYIPNGNNGETATFTYKAWDQTSGTASTNGTPSYANPGAGGGTGAFLSNDASAQIVVTDVNDAPLMDPNGTMTLTTITEDDINNSGDLVSAIIASAGGDRITDVDAGALEGIAIFDLVSSNGTWQYNTGSGWTDVGAVSLNSSLLLRATDSLRFVPDGKNADTAFVTFAARDQTTGTAGTKVDTSSYGGTTAFSDQVETAAIVVTAVNDEQVISTNTGMTVLEGSTGNVITTAMLQTTDIDNTPSQLVYTVTSVPVNGFLRRGGINLSISSTFTQADIDAGLITYLHNDSETTSDSFSFTVDDGQGSTSSGTFNFTVTLVNDNSITAISDTNGLADFVLENASINATVGVTALASDADLGDTVSYSLDDDAGGLFAIDSMTGVVIVAGAIDRETAASYNITVRATSTDATTVTRVFAIAIGDVDEFDVSTPTDSDGAVNQVDENATVGTTVGLTASAFDLDATNNTITYSLTSNPDGLFQIDANTGAVTTAAAIDREAHGATRSITVQASSSDGSTATQSFNITINDLDEFNVGPVSDSNAAANSVAENATIGTAVGITAFAEDLDATNNTITYKLDDDAGGLFAIDSVTGIVTVAGALDYETATSHSITVRANGSDGSFNTQSFTIYVLDINEAPVLSNNGSSASEGGTDTITSAELLASDVDNGASELTFTVTSGPMHGRLERAGMPGVAVTTFTQADIDSGIVRYVHDGSETSTDQFTFDLDDGQGGMLTNQVFDLTVTPVNDAPVASDDAYTIQEDTLLTGFDVTANDFDAKNNPLVARIETGPLNAASFVLNADGTFTYQPAANFYGSDSFTYVVNDGMEDSAIATVMITVQPVNDLPVGLADSYVMSYGSILDTLVGVLANDMDAENSPLQAIIVSQPQNGVLLFNPNGSFTFIPNSGFICSGAQ